MNRGSLEALRVQEYWLAKSIDDYLAKWDKVLERFPVNVASKGGLESENVKDCHMLSSDPVY